MSKGMQLNTIYVTIFAMPNDVRKTLEKLGLKESEIAVYFTCLQNKQGLFVAEITKLTGIKRSTVNLILERLARKGFVTFHLDGSRKLFSAESPEALLFQFEDSLNDLRHLIPLLRIASGNDKKTKIRFFEGIDGIKKIYDDMIMTTKVYRGAKKEILEIASGADVYEKIPDHEKQFIQRRIKERIPIRWIAPVDKVSQMLNKTSDQEFREIKFFDNKKYNFNVEVSIYAEKIALITLDRERSGVIVENKNLADSFRSLFNLLWDHLK